MVRIPYIKIPSVRVGSIVPTSNIGTGGATPAPPTPITYLTQWKIVGNSEVKTLPYADIPQGYTRCKYLEFHGTEYFESGIASKEGVGIICRFKTTTAERFLFGVRNSNDFKSSFAFMSKVNSHILIGYGSTLQDVYDVNLIDGVEHTLQLDNTIAKVDNTDITFTRETIVTPWNIPIGAARTGIVVDSRCYIGYLYSFVLYDADGTLFNGIPCLDDNNTPCLYDTVSGTSFYNEGTGTFGYEIEPQPTEIWSCGEYNATDDKYHILVQPQGGSIVDIALDEPLRKTGNTADTLEYPTDASGKALLTIRVEEIDGELTPLDTPTTELVDAPQIEEAESYSMVISQGGKVISWSSFTTD